MFAKPRVADRLQRGGLLYFESRKSLHQPFGCAEIRHRFCVKGRGRPAGDGVPDVPTKPSLENARGGVERMRDAFMLYTLVSGG